MTPHRKKLSTTGRIVLTLMVFLITLMIVVQAAFFIGLGWVNSQAGQTRIAQILHDATGYQIDLDHASLIGPDMIKVKSITISDDHGPLAKANGVFLSFDAPALLARQANLALRIETLAILRLPPAKQPKDPAAPLLTSFTLPDFYLHQINLNGLTIQHFVLHQQNGKPDIILSPGLDLTLTRQQNAFSFHLAGTLAAENALVAWMPQQIKLDGTLDTTLAHLTLDHLDVHAKAFDVTGMGQAGLGQGGVADVKLEARADDLTRLAASMSGKATAHILLSGPANDPDAVVQSTLQLANFSAKGLADIQINADIHHTLTAPQGTLAADTAYRQKPIALKTAFTLNKNTLTLRDVEGNAPDLTLRGDLSLDTAAMLAGGALTLKADPAAYNDLTGLDLGGHVTASLKVQAKDGKQAAAVTAAIENPRYQNSKAGTLKAAFAMSDIAALWPDSATIDLRNAALPDLTLNRLALNFDRQTDNSYSIVLSGAGQAQKSFILKGAAHLAGQSVNTVTINNIDLAILSDKGKAILTGNLTPEQVNIALDSRDFPLNAVLAAANATASGKIALTGLLATPAIAGNIRLKPVKTIVKGSQMAVALQYQDKMLNATLTGAGKGIHALNGQATLPLAFSLKPFVFDLPPSTRVNGGLRADLDLGILSSFLPPDIILTGNATADITAAGTIAQPAANGSFRIANGAFEQISNGIVLQGIAASGTFKDNRLSLSSLQATDGKGGTVQGAGMVALNGDHAIDLHLTARKINPFRNNTTVTGPVSGDITMTGSLAQSTLKGTLQAGPLDITITERFSAAIPRLNIVEKNAKGGGSSAALQTMALDIAIHMPNQIFVRGWGLDAEFGGDLQASGTLAAPQVNGSLESKRGRYEQFGKRFDITHGALRFQGSVPPSPYLDITAQTSANDITAIIALTGPVNAPAIKLTATPVLPEDEVLSQVLFGKEISKVSPFQALQIAQTLRQFSGQGGGGGLDPLGKLRSVTKLDDLEVNTSDSGETTIGAGKYVTDKVYVSVESGADEKSSVGKVQIDVAPHVKVETKIGQEAQTGGGVLWQWDY